MPVYTYKARDKFGELLTASIEVNNEMEAAASLRSMGYSIISIEKKTRPFLGLGRLWQNRPRSHQHELIFFSRQLSILLKSGISITGAISSISEQIADKTIKRTLSDILKNIESGSSFSGALEKYPDIFSEFFISMVRVGEGAGILDESLDRIAKLNSREFEIKTRVQSAMVYPLILVVVAMVIVTYLLVNIIPKFVLIFKSYQVSLPLPTQILLGISFLFSKFWLVLLVFICAVIIALRGYLKTEKGRYKIDSFLLRVPVLGKVYLNVSVARMCRTLGAMTKSGVPILEALYTSAKTINNLVIRRIVENSRLSVSQGQPLSQPLKASGIFPSTVIQMITLGEKSGKLDQMLEEVASFYDEEVDYTIKNLTTALEPILLLVMGSMVAFIALSVLLPVFNLVKVFKH